MAFQIPFKTSEDYMHYQDEMVTLRKNMRNQSVDRQILQGDNEPFYFHPPPTNLNQKGGNFRNGIGNNYSEDAPDPARL